MPPGPENLFKSRGTNPFANGLCWASARVGECARALALVVCISNLFTLRRCANDILHTHALSGAEIVALLSFCTQFFIFTRLWITAESWRENKKKSNCDQFFAGIFFAAHCVDQISEWKLILPKNEEAWRSQCWQTPPLSIIHFLCSCTDQLLNCALLIHHNILLLPLDMHGPCTLCI